MVSAGLESTTSPSAWICESPRMKQLLDLSELIAKRKENVLITGESGTGKAYIARNIHEHSPRRDCPFMMINCGAFPPQLLESEMFGHERGAFTGADSRKIGLIEQVNGGTLVMDEIGEMELFLQPKLLHVLDGRAFRRVGGGCEIHCDVRFVAATNRNLRQMVERSEFRRDLFYRLNVLELVIPPLRERPEDTAEIARRAAAHCECELSDSAERKLLDYHWPGNVRELQSTISRASLLAELTSAGAPVHIIGPEHIQFGEPSLAHPTLTLVPGKETIHIELDVPLSEAGQAEYSVKAEIDYQLASAALEAVDGNKSQAARLLGISWKTFAALLSRGRK